MHNNRVDINYSDANKVNLQETIQRYTRNWKLFIVSFIIFLGSAYLYIRYSTPQYGASATIMLIQDKSSAPEMAIFKDLEGFNDNSSEIEDEIQIMKSRTLMTTVVKELGLNLRYFTEGSIKEVELYKDSPIKVNFLESDSIVNQSYLKFSIEIISDTDFGYRRKPTDELKTFSFGQNIPTSLGSMVIIPTVSKIGNLKDNVFNVSLTPVNQVADYYTNMISITPNQKGSNILSISLSDPVKKRATDVINSLIKSYNKQSVDERSMVAKNTSNFINERINLLASGLSEIDSNAVRFKSGNRLTNIESETDIYLNASSENEQQLVTAGTELNMVNYMRDYVENQNTHDLIPANVGFTDPTISDVTSKYNELVLERQRLLKSSSEKNPVITNLDEQLGGLRQTMQQSLNNMSNTLNIRLNNLKNQASRINSKIYTVPGKERQLKDIQREQGIKEALYLYLLQKREESAIASATVAPNVKIIDPAFIKNTVPVFPNPKVIYLAGLLLGFGIPFSLIYVKDLFDTKIHGKDDILKVAGNVPFLAEVPKITNKKKLLVERNDRSVLAESFRILRTNLDYFITSRDGDSTSKVIFVTSTISGEGKTFVSYNLAHTLAYSGKKVLIIGADIRKPGFSNFLKGTKVELNKGLTEYLHGKYKISEIIQPIFDDGTLQIIPSGDVPPNPAELLMTKKMDILFEEVSARYDFIIVDTAPAMLVTDTLLLSKFADHTIYVARASYTDKKLMRFPSELRENNKLNGMMMVVNDVKTTNFGYGNKYGKAYKAKTPKKIKS